MPTPNRLDPSATPADLAARINENMDYLDDQERTKVMKSAGVPQILTGYQKNGFNGLDYGTKVSKINPSTSAPYDVTTATDDQLSFSSGWNTLKVVQTGQITVDAVLPGANGATFTTTVPHSLGYIPAILAYVYFPTLGTYNQLPYAQMSYSGAVSDLVTDFYVYAVPTSTNVQFAYQFGYAGIPYTSHSITVRYYLLRESAN